MAHQIEGNSAFFTGKEAWHKLGVVLKNAPSIEEAWKLAYPHELLTLDSFAGIPGEGGNMEYMGVPDKKHIFRTDGKYIATVGKGYQIVQPWNCFNSYRKFIESGEMELEAGGSLKEGTRMWALASVKGVEMEVLKGDPVRGYFLIYTSFDGSLSHGMQFCNERVVCANTLAMAMQEKENAKAGFRFKHTAGIHEKIDNVIARIDVARRDFSKTVEAYKVLASKKASAAQLKAYVRSVFEVEKEEGEEQSAKTENKILRVIDLLDSQTGLELVPAMQGTMWQGYNAVTQYLTHEHGRNEDSRLNSQWFGDSKTTNSKALQLALAQ